MIALKTQLEEKAWPDNWVKNKLPVNPKQDSELATQLNEAFEEYCTKTLSKSWSPTQQAFS